MRIDCLTHKAGSFVHILDRSLTGDLAVSNQKRDVNSLYLLGTGDVCMVKQVTPYRLIIAIDGLDAGPERPIHHS